MEIKCKYTERFKPLLYRPMPLPAVRLPKGYKDNAHAHNEEKRGLWMHTLNVVPLNHSLDVRT